MPKLIPKKPTKEALAQDIRNGLNKRQIAEKYGVSRCTISVWTRGMCRKQKHIKGELANALGMDPEIYGDMKRPRVGQVRNT